MNTSVLREMLRLARPWLLAGTLLFYAIGAGIAHFLGTRIDLAVYILGQACVLLLALISAYLSEYFAMLEYPVLKRGQNGANRAEEFLRLRNALVQAAAVALTVGAVLTVMLFARGAVNLPAILFLGTAFLLAFFYAVPPMRLARSGYGELVTALFLTGITPALAYALQTGETHRLLILLTFPLTAICIAMLLANDLETYYTDIKDGRKTLMVAVGWQRGMSLHNILVLFSYLLVGLAAVLKLPWPLAWPMLATMPVGLFQIWQMWQINNGVKPRWRLLRMTAYASFGIMAYLVAFALWTG
jgi:1,4-dihydroxy-2-naphthoate octaprenyltransferase